MSGDLRIRSRGHGVAALLVLIMAAMLCIQAQASPKKVPLPLGVTSAKSVYIINDTGRHVVLGAAKKQFTKWGRFTIAGSKDRADLIVVFSLKHGLDKWGDIAPVEMNVFVKGDKKPVFQVGNGHKLIFQPGHRTVACINAFKRRLEN